MSLEVYANLVWAAPILGALATPILARAGESVKGVLAVATCAASAASATLLLQPLLAGQLPVEYRYEWVWLPGLGETPFSVLLDPLSVVLSVTVAWVSLLIFIYSLSYMRGDPGITRYWFFMQLFVGGMELLVLSGNLVQMLVGWETVGLCSYALIGYWYRDRREDYFTCWVGEPPEAYPPSHCGMKAFIVTRFGDSFMVAGTLTLAALTGTVSLTELPRAGVAHPSPLLPLSLLLLYMGAVGKSAQLPLMEWLPDAMAGPTSVSALIHAATMVKAGVYLSARLAIVALAWSRCMDTSVFFNYVMWTGVLTALIAALQAAVSTELKKTLAYSTVSQIGYMMAALGAAKADPGLSIAAALSHMLSHAVFKASLFLSAGAVIHAVGSRFYRHYGGLSRHMRITMASMILASLSLMGVPPFSGFWSKDAVLAALSKTSPEAFTLALATASITAFYSIRMIGHTFLGEESEFVRRRAKSHKLHEADATMWVPYVTLAVLSLALGLAIPPLERFLEEAVTIHEGWEAGQAMPLLSVMAVLTGLAPAYVLYIRGRAAPRWRPLDTLRGLLLRRLYINALYYRAFALPTLRLSSAARRAELAADSGLNWLSRATLRLSSAARRAELAADSGLNWLSRATLSLSDAVRRIHTGVLNWNVTIWIVGGAAILLLLLFLPLIVSG